jgi:hypothetical protein
VKVGKVARVLYLGGLGRSGTTLLERILGELPGVCTLGEVVHLWQRDLRDDERCGCGSAFSTCEFWRAVGAAAFGGWDRVDVDRVLALRDAVERTRHIPLLASDRGPDRFQSRVRSYANHYAAVYRAAAQVTGARLLVDSSKHSALAHCLRWIRAEATDIDLRVAHVVRDPRGVAYSWTKTVARPEAGDADAMTRYSPIRSALLWNAHNAAFELLARRGVAVRRLRYEDFLADPRHALRELAAFAGLDVTDNPLHFLSETRVDLNRGHSAAGNPMRFTTGRLPLRTDEVWRTALPIGRQRLVGAVCAPLMIRYGYPPRPPVGPRPGPEPAPTTQPTSTTETRP